MSPTFTETTDPIRGRTFVFGDGRSAVTLHVDVPGIEVHSPTPLHGEDASGVRARECDYIGTCWSEGSSLAARKVIAEWRAAGHNDAAIRVELEEWWARHFGERAV